MRGSGVLITRPHPQSSGISALVSASGGVPYAFPCLEISLRPAVELHAELSQMSTNDLLIFVSANAVRGVFQDIKPGLREKLGQVQIAVVGKSTQAALQEEHISVAVVPEQKQQNTEGLLQHPLLSQLLQRRAFIVRGQSGREALREELTRRGATVTYIEAYTRSMPAVYDRGVIIEALKANQIQFVMLTSFSTFENLRLMLGQQADSLLQSTQLVVPGERIARKIRQGYSFTVHEADNASDESMLYALKRQGLPSGYQSPGQD
jgi:uroporphyrinogen-III synthase